MIGTWFVDFLSPVVLHYVHPRCFVLGPAVYFIIIIYPTNLVVRLLSFSFAYLYRLYLPLIWASFIFWFFSILFSLDISFINELFFFFFIFAQYFTSLLMRCFLKWMHLPIFFYSQYSRFLHRCSCPECARQWRKERLHFPLARHPKTSPHHYPTWI